MNRMFTGERVWRTLTNFWTIFLLIFLVMDFLAQGEYAAYSAAFSVIYAGVLGLYVGTKEFDRWYELHQSRHPGEIFIGVWTTIIFLMIVMQFVLGKGYMISQEAIADYIMVLSVFAVTQKSKTLHRSRNVKKRVKPSPRKKRVVVKG